MWSLLRQRRRQRDLIPATDAIQEQHFAGEAEAQRQAKSETRGRLAAWGKARGIAHARRDGSPSARNYAVGPFRTQSARSDDFCSQNSHKSLYKTQDRILKPSPPSPTETSLAAVHTCKGNGYEETEAHDPSIAASLQEVVRADLAAYQAERSAAAAARSAALARARLKEALRRSDGFMSVCIGEASIPPVLETSHEDELALKNFHPWRGTSIYEGSHHDSTGESIDLRGELPHDRLPAPTTTCTLGQRGEQCPLAANELFAGDDLATLDAMRTDETGLNENGLKPVRESYRGEDGGVSLSAGTAGAGADGTVSGVGERAVGVIGVVEAQEAETPLLAQTLREAEAEMSFGFEEALEAEKNVETEVEQQVEAEAGAASLPALAAGTGPEIGAEPAREGPGVGLTEVEAAAEVEAKGWAPPRGGAKTAAGAEANGAAETRLVEEAKAEVEGEMGRAGAMEDADVGAGAEAKDESEAATSSTPPRAPACSSASEGSEGTASGSRYLSAGVEKRLEALQSGLHVDEGARKLSFSRVSSGDAEAAQPPSPPPQPSPSPSPDTHSSIMRDFEDLLLIDELVTDAFSIFDTEQGGSIAIYSLAELVQDRVYTTTRGNKLLRVSRREILLADRISLRITIDEDEIVASDHPLTPRADANAPRVEPSTSPADHAANAMANAANVAAAVRVQCASRGMLVRLRAMEARAERDRNEWIAYFVGQGLFDDARALGWEGQTEGRAAAETDGCVIC